MMKNGIMLQAFEWNLPADGSLYTRLTQDAEWLASLGITGIWMPPAAKGTSSSDVGYGSYDYWDLGEFDQKGTVRTKYGTRAELEACIAALHHAGIAVYADMVFNHKGGADYSETFQAVRVNPDNRNQDTGEPFDIEGWTGFSFPGRQGAHSDFVWNFNHFGGVDYDSRGNETAIFRILGDNKYWNRDTDGEKGNFDYLMFADIDHAHPEVIEELKRVSAFMTDTLHYDGFRYDALKHISREFIEHLSTWILSRNPDFYFVGEYWKDNEDTLNYYLDQTDYQIDLFDVVLHYNLCEAASNPAYDLRGIFDGTLVKEKPLQAVTFVDNHDSQPGQALESWIQPWFREIAYALILLRPDGYPCIFWGDIAGLAGTDYPGMADTLAQLTDIRRKYAWGPLTDFFADARCIGWVRHGDEEHPGKLVVAVSSGDAATLRVSLGADCAGRTYRDLTGREGPVTTDEEGNGSFPVPAAAVTCWVAEA